MPQNPNVLATIARINHLAQQSAMQNLHPYFIQQQAQQLHQHLLWQQNYYAWIYNYIESCRAEITISIENITIKREQLATTLLDQKIAFKLAREILLIHVLLWFEFESEFKQELAPFYQTLSQRIQNANEYSSAAFLDLIEVAFASKEFGLIDICGSRGICFGPNAILADMINCALRNGDIALVPALKALQAEPRVVIAVQEIIEDQKQAEELEVITEKQATPEPILIKLEMRSPEEEFKEPEIIKESEVIPEKQATPEPVPIEPEKQTPAEEFKDPEIIETPPIVLSPAQMLNNALKELDDKAYNYLSQSTSLSDAFIYKELLAFILSNSQRTINGKKNRKHLDDFEKIASFLRKINMPIRTCCMLLFNSKTHDYFKKYLLAKLPSYSDNDFKLYDSMFNFTADQIDLADKKLNKKIAHCSTEIDRSLTGLYYAFSNVLGDAELIDLVISVCTSRIDNGLVKFGQKEPGNFFHVLFAHESIAVISKTLTAVFKVDTAHKLTCALLDKHNGISPLAMIEAREEAGVPVTAMLHKRIVDMAGTVAKNKPENLTRTLPNAYIDVFDVHSSHNLIAKLYSEAKFAHLATVIQQRHDLRDTLQGLSLAGAQKLSKKFEAQASELVQINSLHISMIFGMDEYLATTLDALDLVNTLLLSFFNKALTEEELAPIFNSPAFKKAVKKYSLPLSIYWCKVVVLIDDDPQNQLATALANLKKHIDRYELDVDKEDNDGLTILIDSIGRGSMPAIRFICEHLNPGLSTGVFAAAISKFSSNPEILEYFAPLYYSHVHEKDLLITLGGIMNNIPVIDWVLAYLKQHELQCIISAGTFASILIQNENNNCAALDYLLKVYNAMCIADRSLRPLTEMVDSERNSLLYTSGCVHPNPRKFSLLIEHGCILDEMITTHKMNIPLFILMNIRKSTYDFCTGLEIIETCLDSEAVRDSALRYSDIDNVGLLEYAIGCAIVVVAKPELEGLLIEFIRKILSLNPPLTRASTRNQDALMHICAYVNNVRILEPVLQHAKNTLDNDTFNNLINARNKDGHTPLDLAVLMDPEQKLTDNNPALKLLQQAGAKLNTLAQLPATGLFFQRTEDGSLRQVPKKKDKLKL